MSRWAWMLVPLVVGLSQPLLWGMNEKVKQHTGAMEAATVLHVVGALVGGLLVVLGLRGPGGFSGLRDAPPWAFLAGALGVCGMAAMIQAIPRLGLPAVMALVVAAQLGFSVLFAHFGWLVPQEPVSWPKVAGVVLLSVGALLVSR